jgi:hypothetical protein
VSIMSEVDFKAGREARADVVYRAARSHGHFESLMQRMVEAAVYRYTHRATPPRKPAEDGVADDADA